MNTRVITTIIAGVIGSIVIILLIYSYVLPRFNEKRLNEPDPTATSSSTPQAPVNPSPPTTEPVTEPVAKKQGSFQGRTGHDARGMTTVGAGIIRLEEDFFVSNGPDYYVYIGTADEPTTLIATLKGNSGSQNYTLPADINPDEITHVWIYCKIFDQNIAVATIQ